MKPPATPLRLQFAVNYLRGRGDLADFQILILRAHSVQHEIPFSLHHRCRFVRSILGFCGDSPFADGMISVFARFHLRNYCFQIRTLLDGVIAVNDESISASETARD
jgi:hypothetical protein